MEKLKKSKDDIVNFIVNSLKGTKKLTDGVIPVPITVSTATSSVDKNHWLFKILGVLVLLFILYKVIEYLKKSKVFSNLGSKGTNIETKIKDDILDLEYSNDPLFDTSNNLNSNQILDFLLDRVKPKSEPKEWCFFGESDGTRYCTLTQGSQCMSGNIFPTKDNCVNPKLKT